MTTDMTRGRTIPLLLKFAAPLLLGNVFQQFYNTFDTYITGRVLGNTALAAIGATSHLVFTVINFFNGLAVGAQVVISQFFGAGKFRELKNAINTTFFASVIFSVFATVIQFMISPWLLKLIATPPDVMEQAALYLKVYFTGTAALVLYNMGSGILRALGDSTRALVFLITSSVVNVVLDIIFVVFLKLGIQGAAWATVISEFLSAVMVTVSLCRLEKKFRLEIFSPGIDSFILFKILKIGLPGAVSSGITAVSNTFMQKYVNVFGAVCMAGWAIFSKLDQIVVMPMHSVSFAATTFVAQNYGAGKRERIRDGIKKSALLNLILMAAVSSAVFAFARPFSLMFTDDGNVASCAVKFIRLTAPFYILCGYSMLFTQIIRGFGISILPMAVVFFSFVVFRQVFLLIVSGTTNSFTLIALAYPFAWPLSILIFSVSVRILTKSKFKSSII